MTLYRQSIATTSSLLLGLKGIVDCHTRQNFPHRSQIFLRSASTQTRSQPYVARLQHHESVISATQVEAFRHGLRLKENQGTYHWIDASLLRDSCACPRCRSPSSGQKVIDTYALPHDLEISACKILTGKDSRDAESFELQWREDPFLGHRSTFTTQQIRALAHRDSAQRPVPWNHSTMKQAFSKGDNVTSFEEYINSRPAYRKILAALNRSGLAFITDVPRDERSVEYIGEKIGPLRHTFYGRTWDVKAKPNAENVAYTAVDLGLHMDLLYMKQPPGLQLLHCIDASCNGGESFFSDSFAAGHSLYARDEEGRRHFQVLTEYPVNYHYNQPSHAFYDTKPVIEAEPDDNADTGMRIKFVNWSPPFQAPFTAHTSQPQDTAFRAYHAAAREFAGVLNAKERIFEMSLPPGCCVIFNNRRVLHGRRAFKSRSSDPPRFLKGAYLDTDDFESQLRVMARTAT